MEFKSICTPFKKNISKQMDEFSNLRSYPKTLTLKTLIPGKYDLTFLRKVNTKFGNSVIVKSDNEEK